MVRGLYRYDRANFNKAATSSELRSFVFVLYNAGKSYDHVSICDDHVSICVVQRLELHSQSGSTAAE